MDIDLEMILQIAIPILTIIFGALSAYFKENEILRNKSIRYIAEAEDLYKDVTKAGGQKFTWVVDTLYEMVPVPLRIVITKKCIEKIVQSTFNEIETYAKMQLDKAVKKIFNGEDKKQNDTELNNAGMQK